MTAQGDPLLQLPQLERVELLVQFRLSGEHDLQELLPGRLQIGQQPYLFQQFPRQVVRFIHHQQGSQFLPVPRQEERVQRQQDFILRLARYRQSKIPRDIAEKLQRRQAGIEDQREGNVALLQQPKQGTQHQGLAGTDFPAQDHESLVRRHAVVQRRQCFVVPRRRKQKRRIGRDLERIQSKLIERFVHVCYPCK